MANLTPLEVADWMLSQLKANGELYQVDAAQAIEDLFGTAFTAINANGNLSIASPVLSSFKKLTVDSVVWDRGQRCWRWREKHDDPNHRFC